jgi:hypothetical protein
MEAQVNLRVVPLSQTPTDQHSIGREEEILQMIVSLWLITNHQDWQDRDKEEIHKAWICHLRQYPINQISKAMGVMAKNHSWWPAIADFERARKPEPCPFSR